jgi:glycosyltransferase involved in cell wall biosynthesis
MNALNKNPAVSVVIAFHNGSLWIERALESAFSQTYKPSEILVVNDGSEKAE